VEGVWTRPSGYATGSQCVPGGSQPPQFKKCFDHAWRKWMGSWDRAPSGKEGQSYAPRRALPPVSYLKHLLHFFQFHEIIGSRNSLQVLQISTPLVWYWSSFVTKRLRCFFLCFSVTYLVCVRRLYIIKVADGDDRDIIHVSTGC